jgi:proteasome accessory factor C
MDKFDRVFQLHSILANRRSAIHMEDISAKMECSAKTVFRIIRLMQDKLRAPIEFNRELRGYAYRRDRDQDSFELPGLWFTAAELQALLTLNHLLAERSGGLLAEHLAPLNGRLEQLMKHKRLRLSDTGKRIRLPALAARPPGDFFQVVTGATLQRQKLWMQYHARGSNQLTERTVSPQRVTFYREAWYLDAWDESRNELRTFAIDRIFRPRALDERALDVDDLQLDEHYATAYGIFGGKADKLAVLVFSKERARWVADERWHPEQQGRFLDDGRYELRIPYRDSRELVMDVLRHGAEVEVIEPSDLRNEVSRQLAVALRRYDTKR